MCHYAMTRYKLHFACVPCRVSFKRHPAGDREQPCPNCVRRPRYRPRTRAEVRARLVVAARTGLTAAEALSRRDPPTAEAD
ncbi:hypothetical protein ACIQVA_09905 [Streptomyces microflavus]|uniref:hypothetical protein n=1 Tax=Streptomyces microflavus TaxID=1919 RepID=UPI0037FC0F21